MNPYLEQLAARLVAGRQTEAPELTPALAEEVLNLAAEVAHGSERRFAPLAAFLAGAATAGLSGADAADLVRRVREELAVQDPPAN